MTSEERAAERDAVAAENQGAPWLESAEVVPISDRDMGTDPTYWQDTYPCLVATMADHTPQHPGEELSQSDTEENAALNLAMIVEDSDDDLEDSDVLCIYLQQHVAV